MWDHLILHRGDRFILGLLHIFPSFSAAPEVKEAEESTGSYHYDAACGYRANMTGVVIGTMDAFNFAGHEDGLASFHIEDEGGSKNLAVLVDGGNGDVFLPSVRPKGCARLKAGTWDRAQVVFVMLNFTWFVRGELASISSATCSRIERDHKVTTYNCPTVNIGGPVPGHVEGSILSGSVGCVHSHVWRPGRAAGPVPLGDAVREHIPHVGTTDTTSLDVHDGGPVGGELDVGGRISPSS